MKSRLPLSRLELSAAAGEVCSTVRQKKWVEESLTLLIKKFGSKKIFIILLFILMYKADGT